jgi:hypothetical protein
MRRVIIQGVLLAAAALLVTPARGADAEEAIDKSLFANARLKTLTESLESKADRFEDKLDAALDSSRLRQTPLGALLDNWTEELEDELDNMAEDFSEKDSAQFNAHFENSMLLATAVNRAMLRREFSSSAESEWNSLRGDLNTIALMMNRAVLPNLTIVTFTNLPPDILTRTELRQVMDELEASTDRFKDKFDKAWYTSIAAENQRALFRRWAELLEDTSDQMLDRYKARNAPETRDKLEQTLLLGAGMNRMMLTSKTSQTPVAEWTVVRQQLNTLARAFGYPVLPDRVVTTVRTGSVR